MDPAPQGSGRVGRRYVVSGRVQGVGFRYFVLRKATALGLSGWVRNLPGGEVEVCVWGTEEAQGVILAQLRIGPRSAQVANVLTSEISDEVDAVSGFQVRD